MRIVILIMMIYLCYSPLSAQKEDYNWVFGHDGLGEGIIINFEDDFTVDSVEMSGFLGGNSTMISSLEGKLRFYSNGCAIFNADHQIMENGDSLIYPGWVHDEFCEEYYGDPFTNNSLILPDPKDSLGYYYIHSSFILDFENGLSTNDVRYSYVDFTGSELGKVTQKGIEILPNIEYGNDYMTACKHSNGSDWWILYPHRDTNVFIKILLDKDGFSIKDTFEIGDRDQHFAAGFGQAAYSPDGSMYAVNTRQGLFIYDFDRETGSLSNYRHYDFTESNRNIGIAFSPNGRFIYCSDQISLHQVDLWREGEDDMVVKIADDEPGDIYTDLSDLSIMRMTPHCQIWLSTGNGLPYYHVIKYPDRKGVACELEQDIPFYTYNGIRTMPNLPNFRPDGPFACDSSIVSSTYELPRTPLGNDLKVFPNPVKGQMNLDKDIYSFTIYDHLGKVVLRDRSSVSFDQIDISSLGKGLYIIIVEDEKRTFHRQKFVKV